MDQNRNNPDTDPGRPTDRPDDPSRPRDQDRNRDPANPDRDHDPRNPDNDRGDPERRDPNAPQQPRI